MVKKCRDKVCIRLKALRFLYASNRASGYNTVEVYDARTGTFETANIKELENKPIEKHQGFA